MGVGIIMTINIGVINIRVIDVIMKKKKAIAEFPKERSNSDITIKGTYPHQLPSS